MFPNLCILEWKQTSNPPGIILEMHTTSVRMKSKNREELKSNFYTRRLGRATAWKSPANVLEKEEPDRPS